MADISTGNGDVRPSGGADGGAGDQRPDLATLRLERMALAQYHDVPPEMIRRMLEKVDLILRTSKSSRAQIAASKLLIELGKLNISAIYAMLMSRQREGIEFPPGLVPEIQIPDYDERFRPAGGDDGTDD